MSHLLTYLNPDIIKIQRLFLRSGVGGQTDLNAVDMITAELHVVLIEDGLGDDVCASFIEHYFPVKLHNTPTSLTFTSGESHGDSVPLADTGLCVLVSDETFLPETNLAPVDLKLTIADKETAPRALLHAAELTLDVDEVEAVERRAGWEVEVGGDANSAPGWNGVVLMHQVGLPFFSGASWSRSGLRHGIGTIKRISYPLHRATNELLADPGGFSIKDEVLFEIIGKD